VTGGIRARTGAVACESGLRVGTIIPFRHCTGFVYTAPGLFDAHTLGTVRAR